MKTTEHKGGNKTYETEHIVSGRKCLIKMGEGFGAKIHIFDKAGEKVEKTFRYNFITAEQIISKAANYLRSHQ